jgi:hypothetical protein
MQSIWMRYYLEAFRKRYNCFKWLEFHIENLHLDNNGVYSKTVDSDSYNHWVLVISFIGKDHKLNTKRIDLVNSIYTFIRN